MASCNDNDIATKKVDEHIDHHVVQVHSFREEDHNDNTNIGGEDEKETENETSPPFSRRMSSASVDIFDDDDVDGGGFKSAVASLNCSREDVIEERVEHIEKFRNDSFHITMSGTDDMRIKHRHPLPPQDMKTTSSATNNSVGAHINQGYAIDEGGGDPQQQQPLSDYLYHESCASAETSFCTEDSNYNFSEQQHPQLPRQEQKQPQVYHMEVNDPKRSPSQSRYIRREQISMEDLEEGIMSPIYVTPPTSPPPLPLHTLNLSSSSSPIQTRDNNQNNQQPSRHVFTKKDLIHKDENRYQEGGMSNGRYTSRSLDQSYDSVQFGETFYPDFFKAYFSHFVDEKNIDGVEVFHTIKSIVNLVL